MKLTEQVNPQKLNVAKVTRKKTLIVATKRYKLLRSDTKKKKIQNQIVLIIIQMHKNLSIQHFYENCIFNHGGVHLNAMPTEVRRKDWIL